MKGIGISMKLSNGKKTIILSGLIFVCILLLISAKSMDALEREINTTEITQNTITDNEVWTEELLDEHYSYMDETDRVIELPGGGMIGGPADSTWEYEDKETGEVITYTLEEYPGSETVAEFRARKLGQPIDAN